MMAQWPSGRKLGSSKKQTYKLTEFLTPIRHREEVRQHIAGGGNFTKFS